MRATSIHDWQIRRPVSGPRARGACGGSAGRRAFRWWVLASLIVSAACTTQVPTWALGPAAPSDQRDEETASATFVPLPVVSLSQTRGRTLGVTPLVLIRDAEDSVGTVLAPSITYNEYTRLRGRFRLYRFFSAGGSARLVASVAQRNDFQLSSNYEDPAFLHRRVWLYVGGVVEDRGRERFYGIGPEASLEEETNYSRGRAELDAWTGYRLLAPLEIRLRLRLARMWVSPGIVPGVRDTLDEFPDLSFAEGHRTLAPRVSLRYDSRDDDDRPTSGAVALAGAELSARRLGSSASFARFDAELQGFAPLWTDRVISAARVRAVHVEPLRGDRLPWLELSRLGGADTLRGFTRERFADAASVLASYEARIRVLTTEFGDTAVDWEVAPFVDAGAVAPRATELRADDVQVSAGLGLRAGLRAGLVGRVDLAVSDEAFKFNAELRYPY